MFIQAADYDNPALISLIHRWAAKGGAENDKEDKIQQKGEEAQYEESGLIASPSIVSTSTSNKQVSKPTWHPGNVTSGAPGDQV